MIFHSDGVGRFRHASSLTSPLCTIKVEALSSDRDAPWTVRVTGACADVRIEEICLVDTLPKPSFTPKDDKVFQLEPSPFKVPSFPSLQIFASSTGDALRQFLASPSLTLALTALRLKEAESLHIYRNGPALYFKPESPDDVLSAMKTLCDLLEKLPSFDGGVNLDGLPPEFKKLSALIREWAEPDEELRSELLGRQSEAALRKFVAAVEPHIPSINGYLDSFGEEPPSEAAAALGRLAECANEARLILGKPKS